MSEKFKKDTTLEEILKNPKAGDILERYNVPCLTCPMAQLEMKELKIGDICKTYGINEEGLLKDLNEL